MILQTHRLILRPLAQSDGPALTRIGRHPDVARMLPSLAYPWTDRAVAKWIDTYRWTGSLGFRLAICLPPDTLIGTVGLYGTPTGLAYFINPDHWGNGYAFEASQALLAEAAKRFKMETVVSSVFQDNPASIRVLEKLGFERVGKGKGYAPIRGKETPSYSYIRPL